MPPPLTIIICDIRPAVVTRIRQTLQPFCQRIRERSGVTIRFSIGSIKEHDAPGVCYVNPANACGVMRGALDRALLKLMPNVGLDVAVMTREWGNVTDDTNRTPYLPLFSALLSRDSDRWLVTVPHVFTPGPHQYHDTRNVFHATHAAISMIISANRAGLGIRTVVMPGFGCGHPRISREEVAKQMTDAFRIALIDRHFVVDPHQLRHPRLISVPLYTPQPITKHTIPFLPPTRDPPVKYKKIQRETRGIAIL